MLIKGDARAIPLRDGVVQCVVTSPPYWGLRDYGVSGQLGLESTPEAYVAAMVEVFREVRRVLADDGTLWLNLGDSYARTGGAVTSPGATAKAGNTLANVDTRAKANASDIGLKEKDLVGIPWMVAFALRADGWYLRSDVIWSKPNPMPESVSDRPTKAHEYIFLLAKGQRVSRVVQFSNLPSERVHFGKDCGPNRSNAWCSQFCVELASAIFHYTQREHQFSLPPFYSEEWQQQADGGDSVLVRGLPEKHRAAALAARFLRSNTSTEQFVGQVYRLAVALPERDDLLKRWASTESANAPSIYSNRNGAIAINHAGQICEFRFDHGDVIIARPSGCSYYYDAAAIAEEGAIEAGVRAAKGSSVRKTLKDVNGRPPEYWEYTGRRNKRSVWSITTRPFSGAHFAVMPEALAEPCIRAGSRPGDLVLDPFIGSGTVGVVSSRLMRRWVGLDLGYHDISRQRTSQRGLPVTA